MQNALSLLRNVNSSLIQFRQACKQVTAGLVLDASNRFSTKDVIIKTPLATCKACRIENQVAFIPILRAGLAMLDCAIGLIPEAKIGYLGLQRDGKPTKTSPYYENLPSLDGANVMLLDPILATGNSAIQAIERILKKNPKTVTLCCIVVSSEGITHISEKFCDVHVYTVAIDDNINAKKYLVPGLGDFGDRFNATI
jgi:uracil phosphoribosyltransferase